KNYQSLSDEQLAAKTQEFKARFQRGETLDDLLPEAFAAVKNAARRHVGKTWDVCGHPVTWEMVHFDVQLIGGMVLHQGKISEMATGEGKTLVATLPLYLNALSGRNVQLVTVNDYLARRDSEWMGPIFRSLGLTVGCLQNDMGPAQRREIYGCDISYGTNSEFGFDYLRDNGMATTREQQVQRDHYFAIVDEVDSILIDEARTPLIISGPSTVSVDQMYEELKPSISRIVSQQTAFCNKLVSEAKELLNQRGEKSNAELDYKIGRMLFQVRQGMPKNKQYLKLMEDPSVMRLIERAELQILSDPKKEEIHRTNEELYFVVDEKGRAADLTEKGRTFLNPEDPDSFVIPDLITAYHEIESDPSLTPKQKEEKRLEVQGDFERKTDRIHHIAQLLRAYCLYEKDVEYVVQNNQVMIVDEFTGRILPGRRWSEGLHQAVEAKEGVEIEAETQTLATITIQNYFRLYEKLAGMTGTAETEANEFHDIYKLDVVVIPPNKPCVRRDYNDVIYKTRKDKFNRLIRDIQELHGKGQPALVGTISVETSEVLSRMLKRVGIPHAVLNAKYHEQEAEIVSRAGQRGAVTIATNMAGRGTDIKLGPGVAELGGLHVMGTERHESRRIDRQLRGRCARQGDPGSSRFFISLEDDLMRLFASGRMSSIMERFGFKEGEELEHPLLNRSVETAQKRVEEHNYSIRKHTLEYDDVLNKQRDIIYGLRNEILRGDNTRDRIFEFVEELVRERVAEYLANETDTKQTGDTAGLIQWVSITFPIILTPLEIERAGGPEETAKLIIEKVRTTYQQKVEGENPDALVHLERHIVLSALDRLWQEHLYNMDALRQGIHLRSYGQRDPLIEYKKEAYEMFAAMMMNLRDEVSLNLFRSATSLEAFENFLRRLPLRFSGPQDPSREQAFGSLKGPYGAAPSRASAEPVGERESSVVEEAIKATPVHRDTPRVKPNEPCPCGSGRKFKKCCGKVL
ncbi:MAG: preprotein translocase subunit SecA, partial [Verrucomicrobiae bacterium]|nr:preprotein translocase subunit SecA [Verrucomicrobiae bacterium]